MTLYVGSNKIKDVSTHGVYVGSQNTNCLTYVPKNINLTLSNGTLTLKAGSKVYVPNGTGRFNVANITSDITVSPPYTNEPIFIYYHNTIGQAANNAQCSGTSNTVSYGYWYDTTNNFIKRINANIRISNKL